jgi:hypothetical protein
LFLLFLARICSIHFDDSSYEIPLRHKLLQYNPKSSRILKPDALPILHLPGFAQVSRKTSDRQIRELRRDQKKSITDLLKEPELEPQPSTSGENLELESQPQPNYDYLFSIYLFILFLIFIYQPNYPTNAIGTTKSETKRNSK